MRNITVWARKAQKQEENMKKKALVAACLLAATVAVELYGVVLSASAQEASSEMTIPEIASTDEISSISAAYQWKNYQAKRNDSTWLEKTFSFTLEEDAWVYFSGCYANDPQGGLQTHVQIYNDRDMTNLAGEYGWGYWEKGDPFSSFFKAGTHYGKISVKWANYEFNGDINIIAAQIPVSKLLGATVKLNDKKTAATITVPDLLGDEAAEFCYIRQSVSPAKANSEKYWGNATAVEPRNEKYTFKVKKNGTYTMRITDTAGNRFSRTVKVKGIK